MTGQPRRPTVTASELRKVQRVVEAIVELHTDVTGIGLCSACLLPVPCPTRQLATGDAAVTPL